MSEVDSASRSRSFRGTSHAFAHEVRPARSQSWGNLWGYLFVAPALLLYLVFNVWPMVRGFTMAFTDYRFLIPNSSWSWNGFQNFIEMWHDHMFWSSFIVSVRFTLLTLPADLVIAVLVAVLVAQVRQPKAAAFYRWVIYLPVIIPVSAAMLLWRQLYDNKLGYINTVLTSLGVANPPDWLSSAFWALPSVAVADLWRTFGYGTLLFLVGIYAISPSVYEAASIDGADGWQKLWLMTLPLLKPIFVLLLVLNAGILGATEQMLILTGGGPENATTTTGLYLYQVAFQHGDLRLGYAAAMSLVLGVIHMLLSGLVFITLRTERA